MIFNEARRHEFVTGGRRGSWKGVVLGVYWSSADPFPFSTYQSDDGLDALGYYVFKPKLLTQPLVITPPKFYFPPIL